MAITHRSDEDSMIAQMFGAQQGIVELDVRDHMRRKQRQAIQANLLKEMMLKRPEVFSGANANIDMYGNIEGNTEYNNAIARPKTNLSFEGKGNLQTATADSKYNEAMGMLDSAYKKSKDMNKESDDRVKNIYEKAMAQHGIFFGKEMPKPTDNVSDVKDLLSYTDMLYTKDDLGKLMTTTDRLMYMSGQLPEDKIAKYKEELDTKIKIQEQNKWLNDTGIGLNSDIPLGGSGNVQAQASALMPQSNSASSGFKQGVDFTIDYENSPDEVNVKQKDQVQTRTIVDPSIRDEIQTNYQDMMLLADLHDASMAFDETYNQSLNPYRSAAEDRLKFLEMYDKYRNAKSDITSITAGESEANVKTGSDKVRYISGQQSSQNVNVNSRGGSIGGGGNKMKIDYLDQKGENDYYAIAYDEQTQKVIVDQPNAKADTGTRMHSVLKEIGKGNNLDLAHVKAVQYFGENRVKKNDKNNTIDFIDPISKKSQGIFLYHDEGTDLWNIYVQKGAVQSNVASLLGGSGNLNRTTPEKNKESNIFDIISNIFK